MSGQWQDSRRGANPVLPKTQTRVPALPLSDLRPWAIHSTALSLSFFLCKMGQRLLVGRVGTEAGRDLIHSGCSGMAVPSYPPWGWGSGIGAWCSPLWGPKLPLGILGVGEEAGLATALKPPLRKMNTSL